MRERFSTEKLTEPAVRITSARPRLESSEQRSEVEDRGTALQRARTWHSRLGLES